MDTKLFSLFLLAILLTTFCKPLYAQPINATAIQPGRQVQPFVPGPDDKLVYPIAPDMKDDRLGGNIFDAEKVKAFENFGPEVLVPDPAETARKLKLLWISCGDQDRLITISQGLHRYLKANNVCHIWNVEPGKHDFQVGKTTCTNFHN